MPYNNNPMLLRSKDKQALIEIFSSMEMPVEVWAYGSRVDGTAHSGSDLDLVVRTRDLQKLPIDVLMDMKEKIQYSNIPIVVELFDWARLPEGFQQNIEEQHEVLFADKAVMANEPSVEYKKKGGDKEG